MHLSNSVLVALVALQKVLCILKIVMWHMLQDANHLRCISAQSLPLKLKKAPFLVVMQIVCLVAHETTAYP